MLRKGDAFLRFGRIFNEERTANEKANDGVPLVQLLELMAVKRCDAVAMSKQTRKSNVPSCRSYCTSWYLVHLFIFITYSLPYLLRKDGQTNERYFNVIISILARKHRHFEPIIMNHVSVTSRKTSKLHGNWHFSIFVFMY